MVDQILPYLEGERVEPQIVIAQCFKLSRWIEKTSVQSHFEYSKLRINPDLEEVRDFRNRFNDKKINDIEMVLQDIKGGKIRTSIPKLLIKWRGNILEFNINNSIGCVLFGDMVDQILPYLEGERVESQIVIAQCFKLSRWNEKTSVQSHFEYSKLRINPDLEEVRDFRNRRLSEKPANSAIISQVSSHGPRSSDDELKKGDVAERPIWIVDTIVSINSGKNDWYYKSCRKCSKKVETPIGNKYECGRCGHTYGAASLRFKVEVMVCDGMGSITLLMWDRERYSYVGGKLT
ncbi:uncharacterized protein LOC107621143 [Arachis ipaensis]|uniref:uncharacterized protein LOC107621143 n=1 Tax=Arachis ipaensis TaxID=130454 RepID=UPI000A2B7812|nr:uncharacterized protein LOC107621143 [Arachis ipaensis]